MATVFIPGVGQVDSSTTFTNGSITMDASQLANRTPSGANGLVGDTSSGNIRLTDPYGDEVWNVSASAPAAPSASAPAPSAPRAPSSSGSASAPSAPSAPSDYGLDGQVPGINTEDMHLKPWENVDVPWNPLYLDQYEEWAKSGFINREVQPEDTVAWQMDNLLDKGSRYITSARQRGVEQAASRGLLNSSLAAGSAERAAIEAALPIAQQDASTYFSQGINNQNLANQFSLARQNAGMTGMMEMDKLNQSLEAEFAKFNSEMELKVDSFNSTMDFEEAMSARELAQQEINNRASLWGALDTAKVSASTSISVANINAAAQADATYKSGLLDIWGNGNLSAEQSAVLADQWKITNGYATASSAVNWDQAYR